MHGSGSAAPRSAAMRGMPQSPCRRYPCSSDRLPPKRIGCRRFPTATHFAPPPGALTALTKLSSSSAAKGLCDGRHHLAQRVHHSVLNGIRDDLADELGLHGSRVCTSRVGTFGRGLVGWVVAALGTRSPAHADASRRFMLCLAGPARSPTIPICAFRPRPQPSRTSENCAASRCASRVQATHALTRSPASTCSKVDVKAAGCASHHAVPVPADSSGSNGCRCWCATERSCQTAWQPQILLAWVMMARAFMRRCGSAIGRRSVGSSYSSLWWGSDEGSSM